MPPMQGLEGSNPAQWGQNKTIPPTAWQQDAPISILLKDSNKSLSELPQVKNLTLGALPNPADIGQYSLRWLLSIGVGGGFTSFEFDAPGLQQLSLSADQLRVSLVARNGCNPQQPSLIPFIAPSQPIEAVAFFAEGMTATNAPTLTEFVGLGVAGGGSNTILLAAPRFASGFRILGDLPATATSPFQADTIYSLVTSLAGGGVYIDTYDGNEIFGFRLAEIPLGPALALYVENTDVGAGRNFRVQWVFDL